jgi:hypothetical protein
MADAMSARGSVLSRTAIYGLLGIFAAVYLLPVLIITLNTLRPLPLRASLVPGLHLST